MQPLPTRAPRNRRSRRAQSGFSLIELIVSLTIFSLLVGSLVALVATGLNVARNNKDRSVAAHLASQKMDKIRQLSFARIVIGEQTENVSVGGVPYKLVTDIEWVANGATSNSCDSTGSSPRVLRASVTVTWTNMRGTDPVTTATEISPPVGSYDPDNGHIAVRVRDRNASALGGIPVRVIGPGVDLTQTTLNTSGCAFFGFLPPATYSVTLGTPGWVDRQSAAVPTQSVGVSAGNVTAVAFDYDQAATIALTLEGDSGGIPANAVSVTVANTGLLPAGVKNFAGVGLLRTLGSLFPFADGYNAWAGACADADPEGTDTSGTRYWPSAFRNNAISVDPGGSTAATIQLRTVRLDVRRTTSVDPVTLVAVHAADGSCPAGSTLTVGTTSVVRNDSLLVALPYGTWTLQAAGRTPNSAWEQVTLDPTDSSVRTVRIEFP